MPVHQNFYLPTAAPYECNWITKDKYLVGIGAVIGAGYFGRGGNAGDISGRGKVSITWAITIISVIITGPPLHRSIIPMTTPNYRRCAGN